MSLRAFGSRTIRPARAALAGGAACLVVGAVAGSSQATGASASPPCKAGSLDGRYVAPHSTVEAIVTCPTFNVSAISSGNVTWRCHGGSVYRSFVFPPQTGRVRADGSAALTVAGSGWGGAYAYSVRGRIASFAGPRSAREPFLPGTPVLTATITGRSHTVWGATAAGRTGYHHLCTMNLRVALGRVAHG